MTPQPPPQQYDRWDDLRRVVSRHEKDLYHGNGKPGLTTRMQVVEEAFERMSRNLGKITWLTIAVLLTLIANLILKIIH